MAVIAGHSAAAAAALAVTLANLLLSPPAVAPTAVDMPPGLTWRLNLTIGKAAREGLTLHGEIDLIAADAARRRIWVMEAKHLRRVFSPLEMGFRIADFHGPGALAVGPGTNEFRQFNSRSFRRYVQGVLANASDVEHNKQSVIRLISAVSPWAKLQASAVGGWAVIPPMVTSDVEIPAFVPDQTIPFILIDHLRELLIADEPPPPGWWSP